MSDCGATLGLVGSGPGPEGANGGSQPCRMALAGQVPQQCGGCPTGSPQPLSSGPGSPTHADGDNFLTLPGMSVVVCPRFLKCLPSLPETRAQGPHFLASALGALTWR